ncbi:MAG: formylglycine-generating enzyme family protein [Spirochaetota bacterium]|jgi:formylglycine-generating enzyme required for sulfatase activity|nr:formylglycine-generating enzyme family protein [Spirochaetota bacterium]
MENETQDKRARSGVRICLWIGLLIVAGALGWVVYELLCTTYISFTVNFADSGGTALSIPPQIIQKGGKVVQPKDPTTEIFVPVKPGLYRDAQQPFAGWRDDTGNTWDFINDTVHKDLTLFAVWAVPAPIPEVPANDIASAFAHINAKPDRYILALSEDISAGTQVLSAERVSLRILGLGKTRTITYTGSGSGTLFSIRENSGTLAIGTHILLQNLAAMQQITAGTFVMGSPSAEKGRRNDEKQHTVRLTKNFYLGKYPVTQELYRFVMGANPSRFQQPLAGERAERRPVDTVCFYDTLVFCNLLSRFEGLTPVYRMSGSANPEDWGNIPANSNGAWNDVAMDIHANGYRLPTEAEWEFACRAGTKTAYNTGAAISNNAGWYAANSKNMTHETGLKPANAWGLYDTHGNVYEWCWDWWAPFTDKEETDPAGPPSSPKNRRAMRSAAWQSPATVIRSAYRDYGDPWHKCHADGFRLVRSAL